MLDTCPMKDDATKNKWFQWTNKDITEPQKNNDQENYGNDDVSVESDADVIIGGARSGISAAKSGCSGLHICHTQSKNEIREGAHGDGVILLDNGSTMSLLSTKLWLTI